MSDDLIERLRTWAKEWPHWKFTEHQHVALLAVFDALAAKGTTKPHQELLAAYQIDQINREIAEDLAREIEREFRQEKR